MVQVFQDTDLLNLNLLEVLDVSSKNCVELEYTHDYS